MNDLLFVCTANQCRSPMAEGLARHALAQMNARDFNVSSAGFLEGGYPAAGYAVQAMQELDVDIASHESQQINERIVNNADVILCMERFHVRELAVRYPQHLERCFTLKEFVRRTNALPREQGELLRVWTKRLSSKRSHSELLSDDSIDDIADPMGNTLSAFGHTATLLENNVNAVIEAIWLS